MEGPPPLDETNENQQSRWKRIPKDKWRNEENNNKLTLLHKAVGYLTSFIANTSTTKSTYVKFWDKINKEVKDHQVQLQMYAKSVKLNVDGSLNYLHPMSLTTKTGANDMFHFHQAMQWASKNMVCTDCFDAWSATTTEDDWKQCQWWKMFQLIGRGGRSSWWNQQSKQWKNRGVKL